MKPTLTLSTSWCSHRHTDGYVMLREMADLGFSHVELSHGIRITLVPGILKAVEEGVIKIGSTHNFCPLPTGIVAGGAQPLRAVGRPQFAGTRPMAAAYQALDRFCRADEGAGAGLPSRQRALLLVQSRAQAAQFPRDPPGGGAARRQGLPGRCWQNPGQSSANAWGRFGSRPRRA